MSELGEVTCVLLVLIAALVVALRAAPRAFDVEPPDAGDAIAVPLRPGAGSIIDARGVPASRDVLEHGGSLEDAEAVAKRARSTTERANQPL